MNTDSDTSSSAPDLAATIRAWHAGGDKIVLFAGNLVDDKGCDRLLDALVILPSVEGHAVRLLVIGAGRQRAMLERRAARNQIHPRVIFAGSRPQSELALWMNVADCLCLPSRSEGMPNVVGEALASGLPVAATSVGETPRLIKDGVNGYCVTNGPRTSPELAQSLRRILACDWNRPEIAAAAPKPTWDDAATEVVKSGPGPGERGLRR